LRFLLRAAEEAIQKPPSVAGLQAQATLAKGELQAIKTELASTVRKQDLDRASAAEERDGRLNEGYVFEIVLAGHLLLKIYLHSSF
jgi:hypothetical protein